MSASTNSTKVERQRISAPSRSSSLADIRAFAAPILRKSAPGDAENLILALDECCANIIRHRAEEIEGGRIEVTIEVFPERLRIWIGRFCRRADVEKIQPRSVGELEPGGLGTRLVGSIMDRVEYQPDPEHPEAMDLVLEKSLGSDALAEPDASGGEGASRSG